ncbi:tudor domain-containing protein 7A-like isoform X1 [Neocloeon triangulifer]|uniref:tudor domain-containing protein 7A-like isoform X1 n=1 Tax=Neocloeon triangulifer TaxID=2078957 RepID=UPI00286FA737|nr:tudor domain-containing protein 7A-like isoform X1 [Neocloeon triangulifer]XP_059472018.1 tudor domain-containing protein 7A-like isoform X1 [Neocloeon triangulifer]
MDEEKVVKMIQSCLILDKKCVTTRELTRLFRDQVGSSIPFARLGYPTLVSFLKTIPGVHKAGTAPDGDILLGYDASHSNMGHIQELIQRQQAKRKPSSAKYSVKRPMQVSQSRFRYSQSMRSYHQQQMSLPKWPKHPSVEMHRPISSAPVAKQNYFATAGPSRPSPSSFRNTNLQVAKEEPFFKQQKPYEESIPASDVPKKASYESGQGDRKSISFTSEQKENLFANLDLHKQINYLHKQFNSQNKVTSGSENVNPACGFKPITDVEMDNNAKLNMKDAEMLLIMEALVKC